MAEGTEMNACNNSGVPVDFPIKSFQYLKLVVYPFLLAICTVGNVTVITFLRNKKWHNTVSYYLTAIAIADLISL